MPALREVGAVLHQLIENREVLVLQTELRRTLVQVDRLIVASTEEPHVTPIGCLRGSADHARRGTGTSTTQALDQGASR